MMPDDTTLTYTTTLYEMPLACHDCGLIYGSDGWIDAVVPDEIWKIINPSDDIGGGTLCINCMARRCVEAGLYEVPVKLTSGPFVV